jgi:hypothetical protein
MVGLSSVALLAHPPKRRTVSCSIETQCEEPNMDGAVECQERLGGVLKYYRRAA